MTRNLNVGNASDLISSNFLQLRREDYRSLTGKNHLNDKIIDEYLHLIAKRSEQSKHKSVYAITAHAYIGLDLAFDKNYGKLDYVLYCRGLTAPSTQWSSSRRDS